MQWLNEPAQWSAEQGRLAVTADPGTDFWRTTSYGYVRDSGHLYGDLVAGDFDLALRVSGAYAEQYDQAGAMVRVDERHWLKTGVEYFDGRMRLSTVVTNDYSSWAVAELPAVAGALGLFLWPGAATRSRCDMRWASTNRIPPQRSCTCRQERHMPGRCARPRRDEVSRPVAFLSPGGHAGKSPTGSAAVRCPV